MTPTIFTLAYSHVRGFTVTQHKTLLPWWRIAGCPHLNVLRMEVAISMLKGSKICSTYKLHHPHIEAFFIHVPHLTRLRRYTLWALVRGHHK